MRARFISPAEQRNHIDEGDYVWCDECGGSGSCGDMGIFTDMLCSACDGEDIVFCGDDEPALHPKLEDAAA